MTSFNGHARKSQIIIETSVRGREISKNSHEKIIRPCDVMSWTKFGKKLIPFKNLLAVHKFKSASHTHIYVLYMCMAYNV